MKQPSLTIREGCFVPSSGIAPSVDAGVSGTFSVLPDCRHPSSFAGWTSLPKLKEAWDDFYKATGLFLQPAEQTRMSDSSPQNFYP